MSILDGEEQILKLRQIERKLDALADMFNRFAGATVDQIRGINHKLSSQGEIMAAIDDLKSAITAEDGEVDAIVAYVKQLADDLANALANDDTAALTALSADVNQHAAELQAAVPAAPAPVDGGDGSTPVDPSAPVTAPVDGGAVAASDGNTPTA